MRVIWVREKRRSLEEEMLSSLWRMVNRRRYALPDWERMSGDALIRFHWPGEQFAAVFQHRERQIEITHLARFQRFTLADQH